MVDFKNISGFSRLHEFTKPIGSKTKNRSVDRVDRRPIPTKKYAVVSGFVNERLCCCRTVLFWTVEVLVYLFGSVRSALTQKRKQE